jgi:hypothetical protein
MKENSQSINHILFGQLLSETAGCIFQNQVLQARSNILHLARKILPTVVATLIMGGVFFVGITLFLYQLAEHGW